MILKKERNGRWGATQQRGIMDAIISAEFSGLSSKRLSQRPAGLPVGEPYCRALHLEDALAPLPSRCRQRGYTAHLRVLTSVEPVTGRSVGSYQRAQLRPDSGYFIA